MYNTKDVCFAGKHDYDKESAERFASWGGKSFSVGIFKWELKSNGKELKRGKVAVRVYGSCGAIESVFKECEFVVRDLDANEWDGRKNVFVK